MSKPAYDQQETTATDRTGETLVEVNDLKTYYGSEGGLRSEERRVGKECRL